MENHLNRIDVFLHIYFYELEKKLIENQHVFNHIEFQVDEANIDLPLKLNLKEFIKNQFSKIPKELSQKKLKIKKNENQEVSIFNYSDYLEVEVIDVFVPNVDDIDQYQDILKKENQRYTNPDLLFLIQDKTETFFRRIELKSTQKNIIPGSSIQQIEPLEWVIFVRRQQNKFDISIGQYINCLNSTIPFPDRSPRPQVSFNDLSIWNKNNRIDQNQELLYIQENNTEKIDILINWQNHLASEWLSFLQKYQKNDKRETWFNQTINMFLLKSLTYYETLSKKDKQAFIEKLKNNQ
jgi:hypothetical protein